MKDNSASSLSLLILKMAFYENILATAHRTLNGEEADFFFVPVLDSCIINRADDAPHINMQVGSRNSPFVFFSCRSSRAHILHMSLLLSESYWIKKLIYLRVLQKGL